MKAIGSLLVLMLSGSSALASDHFYCKVATATNRGMEGFRTLAVHRQKMDADRRVSFKLKYAIRVAGRDENYALKVDVRNVPGSVEWRGTLEFVNPFTLQTELVDNRGLGARELDFKGDGYWFENRFSE